MGFFRKKSDDDAIKDAESSLIEKPVEIPEPGPTPEQIQIDSQRVQIDALDTEIGQKRKEVSSLEELVNTKQDLRKSIEEKLVDVRKEYDSAVSTLMSTKKELNEKRRDARSASSELENIQKRLTDIIADTASAETIRKKKDDELKSIEREHSTVKTQIAEMQRAKSLLQEMKGEITSQQEKNINLKKQIQASENMLQKLEKEKKSVLESVRNAEKSLKVPPVAKIENAKNQTPAESKSVVEAASAVVASMTQKLRSAENELTVVKSLLQKERQAHEATRKKFAKIEKS